MDTFVKEHFNINPETPASFKETIIEILMKNRKAVSWIEDDFGKVTDVLVLKDKIQSLIVCQPSRRHLYLYPHPTESRMIYWNEHLRTT